MNPWTMLGIALMACLTLIAVVSLMTGNPGIATRSTTQLESVMQKAAAAGATQEANPGPDAQYPTAAGCGMGCGCGG